MKTHQCKAELVVSCSTRVIDEITGRWKNSYHVVITNLVFKNNHDGAMAAFWTQFRKECLAGDEWYWHKMKDDAAPCAKTHYMDSAVYTRNRAMRLPLCSKLGSDVAFQRVSGNPLDPDDVFASTYDERDPDAWLPFAISNPAIDGSVVCVKESLEADIGQRVKNMKRRTEESSATGTPCAKMARTTERVPTVKTVATGYTGKNSRAGRRFGENPSCSML